MTIDTREQKANACDVVCNGFYGRRLNPVDTVSLWRALRRGVAIELAVALALILRPTVGLFLCCELEPISPYSHLRLEP